MKILRVLRVLRPLRAINRAKGLKVCSKLFFVFIDEIHDKNIIFVKIIKNNHLACSAVRYCGRENYWQHCSSNMSTSIHVCGNWSTII